MSEAPQAIAVKGGPLRPGNWYTGLADPERDVVVGGGAVARLLHFKDTPPAVEQPALTENILVLHLGEGKRVSRERGVRREVFDVPSKRLTIIPAFEANRWHTYGPRNFAHLTLSTGFLAKLAVEEFDRDPREMALLDQIAFGDELLSSVYLALLEETRKARDGLYQETLLLTAALHILGNRSTLKSDRTGGGRSVRGGLASWQLRRLVDFINAHLAEEISILQLSELTGLSRAQFFRAFRQSTGTSPHRYVTSARIQCACRLLRDNGSSVHPDEIGRAVGLGGPRQFSTVFRTQMGVSPQQFVAKAN